MKECSKNGSNTVDRNTLAVQSTGCVSKEEALDKASCIAAFLKLSTVSIIEDYKSGNRDAETYSNFTGWQTGCLLCFEMLEDMIKVAQGKGEVTFSEPYPF